MGSEGGGGSRATTDLGRPGERVVDRGRGFDLVRDSCYQPGPFSFYYFIFALICPKQYI